MINDNGISEYLYEIGGGKRHMIIIRDTHRIIVNLLVIYGSDNYQFFEKMCE